jgi:ribonuclease I
MPGACQKCNTALKKKTLNAYRLNITFRPKFCKTDRNGRDGPKWSEIQAEVEHRGVFVAVHRTIR